MRLEPSRWTLNDLLPDWHVFRQRATTSGSPPAAAKVGIKSSCAKMSLYTVPGLITPGQRMTIGTRNPPSQLVAFSPRNGVLPPSGQVITSAPLSGGWPAVGLLAM